jgi:hypothetical protein
MYITDLRSISPQKTYTDEFLNGELVHHDSIIFNVEEPNYMELIPRGLLRRMGKAVRMGVGTGLPLIQNNKNIDGILMGTANGGLENCIDFLNQIVEYEEGMLTPTNFVQSTPNAIAGQLALMDKNRGYNTTYTNGGHAFENTLLDALMLFEEGNAKKLLIGGIEEISNYNYNIDFLADHYKEVAVGNFELIDSLTKGSVCGEGSNMFIVESEAIEYLAKIEDVAQLTFPKETDIEICISALLKRNGILHSEIDTLMLGMNGDINHNAWYTNVSEKIFPDTNILTFKHLVGEYRTCTSFAVWLAAHILNGESAFLPSIEKRKIQDKPIQHILIYNHFDEVNHSFILLKK